MDGYLPGYRQIELSDQRRLVFILNYRSIPLFIPVHGSQIALTSPTFSGYGWLIETATLNVEGTGDMVDINTYHDLISFSLLDQRPGQPTTAYTIYCSLEDNPSPDLSFNIACAMEPSTQTQLHTGPFTWVMQMATHVGGPPVYNFTQPAINFPDPELTSLVELSSNTYRLNGYSFHVKLSVSIGETPVTVVSLTPNVMKFALPSYPDIIGGGYAVNLRHEPRGHFSTSLPFQSQGIFIQGPSPILISWETTQLSTSTRT